MGLRGIVAAAAAAVLGGLAVVWRRFSSYDGLNVVSFSSKLIAASRAVEAEEEHPLVVDPLAAALAGTTAVAASRARCAPAPPGSDRQYKVGKMALRTRWFDDQLEAALGMPVSIAVPTCLRDASALVAEERPPYVWSHPSGHEPRQLVMLGAGMDSRPWRMKLPADLDWYEVDQQDVVENKRKLLKELAAEVPLDQALDDSGDRTPTGTPKSSGLTRNFSLDKVRFPLRCASWTAVPADLTDPAWAGALLASGFDPTKPTVWVAEGLLMYLQQDKVEAMLRKVADLSPPGSVLVTMNVTAAVVERARKQGKAGRLRGRKTLMSTWVFGVPNDPTQFLASCGWSLQLATDRPRQAAALGLDPTLLSIAASATDSSPTTAKEGGKGKASGKSNGNGAAAGGAAEEKGNSLFMVATPAAAVALAN